MPQHDHACVCGCKAVAAAGCCPGLHMYGTRRLPQTDRVQWCSYDAIFGHTACGNNFWMMLNNTGEDHWQLSISALAIFFFLLAHHSKAVRADAQAIKMLTPAMVGLAR